MLSLKDMKVNFCSLGSNYIKQKYIMKFFLPNAYDCLTWSNFIVPKVGNMSPNVGFINGTISCTLAVAKDPIVYMTIKWATWLYSRCFVSAFITSSQKYRPMETRASWQGRWIVDCWSCDLTISVVHSSMHFAAVSCVIRSAKLKAMYSVILNNK